MMKTHTTAKAALAIIVLAAALAAWLSGVTAPGQLLVVAAVSVAATGTLWWTHGRLAGRIQPIGHGPAVSAPAMVTIPPSCTWTGRRLRIWWAMERAFSGPQVMVIVMGVLAFIDKGLAGFWQLPWIGLMAFATSVCMYELFSFAKPPIVAVVESP